MVQNIETPEPKRRGRPRAYDPETALLRAMDAFWKKGYSGTSLDDLCAATGMNRPSLYAAFGDKRALYLKALAHYWEIALGAMRRDLAAGASLSDALMRAYEGALSIYFSGEESARGCFAVGTGVTEALEDSEVRGSLGSGFLAIETDFAKLFRTAQEKGELAKGKDPAILAALATALMHSIAIRARSGVSRGELREVASGSVGAILA